MSIDPSSYGKEKDRLGTLISLYTFLKHILPREIKLWQWQLTVRILKKGVQFSDKDNHTIFGGHTRVNLFAQISRFSQG